MKNKLESFLKELTELTLKYKIEIGGCGCCGSPWLKDLETGKYVEGYYYDDMLEWDNEENRYYFR